MTEDLCMAFGKLPLKLSRCRSPWHRPQHLVIALTRSIFWLSAPKSSLCWNGLQRDCCGACLSALSGWLLERMEGLSNGALTRCLPSLLAVLLTSTAWPLCNHSAAQGASFSCLQCWQCRDLYQLACFEGYPKTDATAVRQLSRRWGLGVEGIATATSSSERSFPKCSILTQEPTRTAIGARSLSSQLGEFFLLKHSTGSIETRHQQLHSLCPIDN